VETTNRPGPLAYENWLTAERGESSAGLAEVPVFTDAYITGEVTDGYGPYSFINTINLRQQRILLRPPFMMRISYRGGIQEQD
jgi:hypothetical protein